MKKEFEIYQDEEGNVYTITTELEQLIIQDLYKAMKRNNEKQDEIERLHSIIKEVREYIEENTKWYDKELGLVEMKGYNTNRIPVIYLYGLLRILDKENK